MNEYLPLQRDLPPGHLEVRRRMLLGETALKPKVVRGRSVVLAAGLASALVAVAALAVALDRRTTTNEQPVAAQYLVSVIRSPHWNPHVATWNYQPVLDETDQSFCESGDLFGCGGFVTPPEPVPMPSSATRLPRGFTKRTEIDGGTKAQRDLLRTIIRATRPSPIDSIGVISSPRRVSLEMTGEDRSSFIGWQKLLVASAFRDRMRARGRKVAVELEGNEIPDGPSTLPGAGPKSAAEAQARFEDAAASAGATLGSLRVSQPYGAAVAATIETSDPAKFLVHGMPTFLDALGDPWEDYDGIDIRLVDENGDVVWEFSTAGRTGTGSVGAREDLLNCGPIANHGGAGPPCPAQ